MIRYSCFILNGFILLTLNLACKDKRPNYQAAIVKNVISESKNECNGSDVELLPLDTANSVIYWKGTEFGGSGKHEGTLRFSSGLLEVCGNKLSGGWFIVDMHSIYITDMPLHETEARQNLREHLMSDDFFAVKDYPTATFQITAVEPFSADSAHIAGGLTIRGVSHNIAFNARIPAHSGEQVQSTAQFSIVRQMWDINFIGSKLTSDLIDDNIYLDIRLLAHQ